MAITVQSIGTGVSPTGGTLTVTAPTGIAAGDLLLATAYHRGSSPTITLPSGWTQIRTDTGGSGVLNWYAKIATVGDVGAANYSWTSSLTSQPQVGQIRRITGADTSDVNALFRGSGSHTSHVTGPNPVVSPAATGGSDGDMALRAVAGFFATTTSTGVGTWGSPIDSATVTNVYTSGNLLTTARETLAGGGQPSTVNVQSEKPAGSALALSQDTETTVILKLAPSTIAPVFTVQPTVTIPGPHNPPRVGENIVGHIGTVTGTPTPTITIEFHRGGTLISGTQVSGITDQSTTGTYTGTSADVGQDDTFYVTATNSAGTVTAESTPPVVFAAQPALTQSDLPWLTSATSGLGGAPSTQIVDNVFGNIFDGVTVPTEVATAQLIEYRVVYLKNIHATATFSGVKAYVSANTPDAQTDIAIAHDPTFGANVNYPALSGESATPPNSLTFVAPGSSAASDAVALGSLAPGDFTHLIVRRVVQQGASPYADDTFTIAADGVAA
jgi:hypothetical protein